ncbi:hypothetical protein M0D68_06825 [Paraburkholderia sp. SEWSISQ10-3 4]|uniref:hypothetical protein n=1 Tax=Paraburkholderia TaxID=1822464 RepID=UPI002251E8C7|nr:MULTISPECIES: hypothetical protein [Paraburkholderia]MCX4137890.1 hypothetical protein [Paraburkholderia aspalathi]MDN7170581.1 hypothetical protein [Paraburkholderia sp. SEWSISQ10-3 4]MDQ6500220.1 hypothetical protein [Paraburkholderia aspalathi]
MEKKRIVAMLLAVVALVGVDQSFADDVCTARAHADKRLDPIRAKLPEVITSPTIQQLADHSKPTKIEKQALVAYDEDRSFCEQQFGALFNGEAASAFALFVSNSRKLRASLYSGQIDYATFVSTDSDNLQAFLNYNTALQARAQAQAAAAKQDKEREETRERVANEALEQQQEEFEADQKRQKMQAISDALQRFSDSLRRPQPVVTNCQSSYGNTRCTTY